MTGEIMNNVICVHIPRKLVEEAKQLGLNISEIVEKALHEAIEAERKRRLAESLKMLSEAFGDETTEEWVKAIKESRGKNLG
jgi:post-segregation antitoxin (ccd killing protein)